MGPFMTSWALFQIVLVALGGERGIDNYVHHVLVLATAIPSPYFNVCGELILFGIATEVRARPPPLFSPRLPAYFPAPALLTALHTRVACAARPLST